MPFWFAVVLLILAVSGIVLSFKFLQKGKPVRILCVIGCTLLALACAAYIGLTILFVDAVQHQPPSL